MLIPQIQKKIMSRQKPIYNYNDSFNIKLSIGMRDVKITCVWVMFLANFAEGQSIGKSFYTLRYYPVRFVFILMNDLLCLYQYNGCSLSMLFPVLIQLPKLIQYFSLLA